MKKDILHNLENLLKRSLIQLKGATLEKIITSYINETNQHYLSIGVNHYLEDKESIELNKLKKNPELKQFFQKAIEFKFNENQIIEKFKLNIQNAFAEIKVKDQSEQKVIRLQAIFLEYDLLPTASIYGYGKGDYLLLKKPKYLGFYPKDEIFISIEKIDYSTVWKNLISFNNTIEQYGIDDYIFESDIYLALKDAYIFKTYILLHKAFDGLGNKIFDGIEIEKPLMIYGSEHDCEAINIYMFE
ncbi:hypothetical protein KUL156_49140 [Alteromonas sp. KUL156]|nr:hypothetical protein KUL154_15720 [Alteromonas sp. KUL154]GFE02322.1 hypothetical protein KUL156_49140 [Alteromonas sp. KUL156]